MTKKSTFRKPATDAVIEYLQRHKTATFAELIAALPRYEKHTLQIARTRLPSGAQQEHAIAGSGGEYFGAAQGWPTEPRICRVVDGVADWKHRIFALGNGQVPRVAATAWRLLHQRLEQ